MTVAWVHDGSGWGRCHTLLSMRLVTHRMRLIASQQVVKSTRRRSLASQHASVLQRDLSK